MSNGQSFVDVLRKIKYPGAEELDGSSFDYMFEHFELLPFLECFCSTIGEENVITSEELEELKTLPSDDTFEGCFESALLPLSVQQSEEELNDEIEFLKAELDATVKSNKVLEQQISNLRSQEEISARKADEMEALLSCERKKYRKLQDEDAPSAERKVVADLEHLIGRVEEMDNLLSKPSDPQMNTSKTFSQLNLKPYLKAENLALEHINSYVDMSLNMPLNQGERRVSYDPEDGLRESTLISGSNSENSSELSLLMDSLKVSEEAFLRASYQQSKAENSLKFYKERFDIDRYLQTSSVLRAHVEEAQETLKKFEREEKRLLLSIPDVVQEYIQVQCNWISVLHSREKLTDCKSLLMKQKLPLDSLHEQRARLEILSMFMEAEENDLKNIGLLISNINSVLGNERQSLLTRETEMDKILEETVPTGEIFISENSVLSSLHKILSCGVDCFYVTPESLLEKAVKLKNTDRELDEKLNSTFHLHVQYVKVIEGNSTFYDDLLYEKKWNSSSHPASLLQSVATDLNKSHLKLQDLEALIMKVISNHQKKHKMIQQNMTLKKARQLFVTALVDPSHFQQTVEEIKLQIENTSSK